MMHPRYDPASIQDLYRKHATTYDRSGICALDGWRKKAIQTLNLKPGDRVVDIGCGTGLNFALLQESIGPEGKLIGVDLTDAMLRQAQRRVDEHGWKNVDLVQIDAAHYGFPSQVDGIISTFALTFIPDCARVIQNGSQALASGRRYVVLDMAWPPGWPRWWRHLLFSLPSYGITADVIRRRPWEIVHETMKRYLVDVVRRPFWMGFFYLASSRQAD